ncbi:glycosylphosphatidylinositol-mannosyltransferase [Nitzschia inconspicua]|uniref:Glycosylphosphatidylinositol-mannosyltransferase n=1 Tax=Nitzschia inconspicua TaxID=303405 RepID=A0A9K3KEI9_9STRA|nr:glycosylphosphatidylinositol-mannosyltransferase [Nitzschia inconspicua]
MDVLLTMSPNVTVFSCFTDLEEVRGVPKSVEENAIQRQTCCETILPAWYMITQQEKLSSTYLSAIDCQLQLAEVPMIEGVGALSTAFFTWIVPVSEDSLMSEKQLIQLLYQGEGKPLKTIENPTSPYHLFANANGNQDGLMSSPSSSALGPNGGMHRLLHHSLPLRSGISSYYLYFVVPQGMFIDIDDPLETNSKTTAIPIPSPDAKCSFELYPLGSPQATAFLHLHAAKVCDIEQPAFVSGQHLLVWHIDAVEGNNQNNLEFATKLHFRYPQPSNNLRQNLNLPKPIFFTLADTSTVGNEKALRLEILERVWVAAGNDNDHDWVMWTTVASCLLGVVLMLQDISKISMWDDV